MTQKLEACDCLNRCGDDPAVSAGRRKPCESLLTYLAKQAGLIATVNKARELAAQAEKHGAVTVSAEDMRAIAKLMPAIPTI